MCSSCHRAGVRLSGYTSPACPPFEYEAIEGRGSRCETKCVGAEEYDSWNYTEKLVLFIYLEHMILIARLVLRLIFPQVPGNVELLQLKQEHMVHRCLENIKVEQNQDFSMFRDHRSSNIQVRDGRAQASSIMFRGTQMVPSSTELRPGSSKVGHASASFGG